MKVDKISISSPEDFVETLINEITEQRESAILSQLNDLIRQGSLVVVDVGPELMRDISSGEVKVITRIKIILKADEYRDKLEAENRKLKKQIAELESFREDVLNRTLNMG